MLGCLQQVALQRLVLVYQKRSQQFLRLLCCEARIGATTGRSGGVEGSERKIPQFVNAAPGYSDAQSERYGHGIKLRPRRIPFWSFSATGWARAHRWEFYRGGYLDPILVSLRDGCEPIRFAAEQEKSRSRCVVCTPITSHALTARRFRAGRDASQLLRRLWASREAITIAVSQDIEKAQCFKYPRESSEEPLPSSGAGRSGWCSLKNTAPSQ